MILLIIACVLGAVVEGHAPSWGYDPGLYRHCATSTGKPGDVNYWADRPDCNGKEAGWLAVINSERVGEPGVSCPGLLNRSYTPQNGPASFRWSRERDFSYQVEVKVDRRGFSDECGDMWTFAALYDRLERGSRFPEPSRLVTRYRLSFEREGAARIILGASFATDTKRLIIEINLDQDIPGMPVPDSEGVVARFGDWYLNGRTEFVILDGKALGIAHAGDLHWGRLLELARFSAQPDRVQSVYFGVEATTGVGELTMSDYEVDRDNGYRRLSDRIREAHRAALR